MPATLIILAVLSLALLPLLRFMPSKQTRLTASLRERAAVSGLFVEFRQIPGHELRRKQAGVDSKQVIYYGKRLPASRGEPRSAVHWLREAEDWVSPGGYRAPPAALAALNVPVLAAGVDENSCGVYWVEGQSLDEVDLIAQCLEAWAEQLLGR